MFVRYEELRLDVNKTQSEIAEQLNVKRNTYSKWENCINDMPLEKCNELANFYHTTLDYLLGLSNIQSKILSPLKINWNLLPTRLLKLRKQLGLTQEALSNKLGFVQRTYSHYENGTRSPTTLKLLIIAQFYKVSADYLVGRSSESKIMENKLPVVSSLFC